MGATIEHLRFPLVLANLISLPSYLYSESIITEDLYMRGWYSRGYLPHCDEPGRVQFITYRLHDSMPKEVLDAYDEALLRKEIDEC